MSPPTHGIIMIENVYVIIALGTVYACTAYSTVCGFVDRQKVAKFQTRHGVERVIRWKYTLLQIVQGLGTGVSLKKGGG